MTPLSDRAAVLLIVLALGLCFALAFWAARLSGPAAPPLQWREAPSRSVTPPAPASGSLL